MKAVLSKNYNCLVFKMEPNLTTSLSQQPLQFFIQLFLLEDMSSATFSLFCNILNRSHMQSVISPVNSTTFLPQLNPK
jgi:hypothetical protein